MPSLRINGTTAAIEAGGSILEAARRAGVDIPTLCYDPRVTAGGSCRLCVVELAGVDRPVPACTYPARDGLVVRTDSDALNAFRRRLLELVLSENPDDCPGCAALGLCDLHRLAADYGAQPGRFAGARSGRRRDDDNPLIGRQYDACIACTRCTRVCNELEQVHAIVPGGKGFSSHITTLLDRDLRQTDCTFCGQCVGTCPTGALVDLPRARTSVGAEITASVHTTCAYCGVGCGVVLDVAGERILGVRGDIDSPVSHGSLCVKGQFGWEFVHDSARLTTPLIRRNGALQPATWDEALDLVAERIGAIKEEHGPNSMVFWSSSRATNEANYLFQKMVRAGVGTHNIDNCART